MPTGSRRALTPIQADGVENLIIDERPPGEQAPGKRRPIGRRIGFRRYTASSLAAKPNHRVIQEEDGLFRVAASGTSP
ncbi:MAG: hypothetical protein IPJ94_31170 [Chloroflexi bacterium]|nr:hypothetical protein [Chloroflexota bacterium]